MIVTSIVTRLPVMMMMLYSKSHEVDGELIGFGFCSLLDEGEVLSSKICCVKSALNWEMTKLSEMLSCVFWMVIVQIEVPFFRERRVVVVISKLSCRQLAEEMLTGEVGKNIISVLSWL